jgi:hypothetical protein
MDVSKSKSKSMGITSAGTSAVRVTANMVMQVKRCRGRGMANPYRWWRSIQARDKNLDYSSALGGSVSQSALLTRH